MTRERELPRPGDLYRHFKNKLYQIVTIAYHSETGEKMVVYQALYGSYRVWVRPLSIFMEEVDRRRYPEAEQKYRFERVAVQEAAPEGASGKPVGEGREQQPGQTGQQPADAMNPNLLAFFDAMDEKQYDKMLEALKKLSETGTQKELDDICMVLDMERTGGSMAEQVSAIRAQLLMLKKFGGERLR